MFFRNNLKEISSSCLSFDCELILEDFQKFSSFWEIWPGLEAYNFQDFFVDSNATL